MTVMPPSPVPPVLGLFFFSSSGRHTRFSRDWSSDVCSSDLITFQTQDSLTLAATALIGGIFSLWGAIVAGIFNQLLPFLFQAQWGVNPNFLLIIFGAGLLQVLLTAPGGLADQFPKDMANLGRLIWRGIRKFTPQKETAS